MKTLIVFYSNTGNNRVLAQELKNKLNADILEVEEFGKRTGMKILLDIVFNRKPAIRYSPFPTHQYDLVLIVAPIWAAKIANPMRVFLRCEKSNLKRYAFISICGGATGEQVHKIREGLYDIIKRLPVAVCQLSINDLLPAHQKDKVKYTSSYRIGDNDLDHFKSRIKDFIDEVETIAEVLQP